MSFDWTTFVLEVLNFFLLLWILRHFLYRPVLEVIRARQSKIEGELQDASQRQAEALTIREQCEARLAAWEQEKAGAHAVLEQEIAAERERLLEGVSRDVAELKARYQAQDEHERQTWRRVTEQEALTLGGRFIQKLLERLASPEMEARLVEEMLEGLARMSEEEVGRVRAALLDDGLEIVSAFPLNESQCVAVSGALSQLAGRAVCPVYREDPANMSGLRIHAGSWVLGANLRDELKFFQDIEDNS